MSALAETLCNELVAGNRRALARAITLVESTRADHRAQALDLLSVLRARPAPHSLRLGLTGTPGVGKSSFIERFGMARVEAGAKVAVLAIDPSSARSGGSILGDKTRMDLLSRHPNAFIRPSPSLTTLGGVALRTREVIRMVEHAGFDLVIVETVGVGQSETLVAEMTDLFVLLMAPAGGDELQGVKRGIMELADLVLVNKADGDLKAAATRTCADYAGALRLMRKRDGDPDGFPMAQTVSAWDGTGLEDAWAAMVALATWRKEHGVWDARRAEQEVSAFRQGVAQASRAWIEGHPAWTAAMAALRDGRVSPEDAVHAVMSSLTKQA
ncbi:MAG: methylmalonyl Co-A mutase-associated GTPase MeaB [Pseudomonadota bacterium]